MNAHLAAPPGQRRDVNAARANSAASFDEVVLHRHPGPILAPPPQTAAQKPTIDLRGGKNARDDCKQGHQEAVHVAGKKIKQ